MDDCHDGAGDYGEQSQQDEEMKDAEAHKSLPLQAADPGMISLLDRTLSRVAPILQHLSSRDLFPRSILQQSGTAAIVHQWAPGINPGVTLKCAVRFALNWVAFLAAVSALTSMAVRAAETDADTARLLDIIVKSYPDFLDRHEDGALVWKDGTRMPFDDGIRDKPFEALLDKPSIRDMFYAPYPLAHDAPPPGPNVDPGRVRYEPLFAKMYGDCRKREVEKSLVDVVWLPKKWGKPIRVSKVNGAAEALRKVSAELDQLPASFDKFLFPLAGTYNCRPIAGTTRISAHGFGLAVDISTRHAHYWLWAKGKADPIPYRNAIPPEIVTIFEKHGFIWGGKWYHYDTMHFEYRPEMIAAGKR